MASIREFIEKESEGAAEDRITGLGKIIHVEESIGFIQSTKRQRIYFGENQFYPFTKGILGILKRGDHLYFEAKRCIKKGSKCIYSASKVWKLDMNEVLENARSSCDQGTAMKAMDFLRRILKSEMSSLNVGNLLPLLNPASPQVRELLSNENNVKKLLIRFPSAFQFHPNTDNFCLVDEKVHNAIDFIVDQFKDSNFMRLDALCKRISAAPTEIQDVVGHNITEFKLFLSQYYDVFQVSRKDGHFSVLLRLDASDGNDDSCDSQSVGSLSSQTLNSNIGIPSLSAVSSVLSLSALSNFHESTNDPLTDLKPVDMSAKQRGISKLLNALLNKEPIPLQNLIGHIHTSPPDVRNIIGNKMDKFTNFIRNDDNFFLLQPSDLVFIRRTVEKRALKYLMDVVRKYEAVKLTDLLKFDVKEVPPEVKALFGRDLTEISISVRNLLGKQELVPYCSLILHNDVISTRSSSSRPVESKSNVSVSISKLHSLRTVLGSSSDEIVAFDEENESCAVEFLQSIIERQELLTVANVKNYLWQVSSSIRQIFANESLIRDFTQRHPSVFQFFPKNDVIQLVDDNIRDAVAFFCDILSVRGKLLITSLVGHLSSASARIRLVTGGTPDRLREFFKRYFDVFHLSEERKGFVVALKRLKSQPTTDLSSLKQEVTESNQSPATVDVSLARPTTVNQKDVCKTADKESSSSDEPELDFLVDLLKDRGALDLKDIARLVSDAPTEMQDKIGRSDEEIWSYIEENPSVFKVSQRGRCVELTSEDEGDAIEFFLDVLNTRGPTPVSEIHGHLLQATEAIRKVAGDSPESVTSFLLQFSNVFRTFRDKDIDMIESLYEGKNDADGDLSLDSKRSPEALGLGINRENETASMLDGIDFDSLVGLPLLKSKSSAPLTELVLSEVSSLLNDEVQMQQRRKSGDVQFSDDRKLVDVFSSESLVVDICDGNRHKPICSTCTTIDGIGPMGDKMNIPSPEVESNRTLRVDAFTEAQPSSAMMSGDLMLPPFCAEAPKTIHTATLESKESQSEVLSVINLVKDAKDEQNVAADLCYETLISKGRGSVHVTELLLVCRRVDPLGRKWPNMLSLQHLNQILEADDRFFVNKASSKIFLGKNVERMAVAFLRECILNYGPISFSGLKYYNYLKRTTAEVQALLSSVDNPDMLNRKAIKGIWPKYRDQLFVEDGALVIPFDIETEAVAFLSQLIETLGPIPVDSLFTHLLQAPMEVSKYFEERIINIKVYLSSQNLVKHFCVVDETVDLVRSGNLQKSRLLTELRAKLFVADVIRTHGPIKLKGKKMDFLRNAPAAVRLLLGNQWNATTYKKALLTKLCSERSSVFVVGMDAIDLVGNSVDFPLQELSDRVSVALKLTSTSKTARELAMEFLIDIMIKQGPLNLRAQKLDSNTALLSASPPVRILLGGEANSLKFNKTLVTSFCSSYPKIFTVYKKSVYLSRSERMANAAASISGSQGAGFVPTHLGESDLFTGNNTEDGSVAMDEKNLLNPVSGKIRPDVQHATHLESHFSPNAVYPSGFSLSGADLPRVSVPVFPTCITSNNQPLAQHSFHNIRSRLSHGGYFNATTMSILPPSTRFPMDQIPMHPYSSLNPLGYPMPVPPDWMASGTGMYWLPQYLGCAVPLVPNAVIAPVTGVNIRRDAFSTSISPAFLQKPSTLLPCFGLRPSVSASGSSFHSERVSRSSLSTLGNAVNSALSSVSCGSVSNTIPPSIENTSSMTDVRSNLTTTALPLTAEDGVNKLLTDFSNEFHFIQDCLLNSEDSEMADKSLETVNTNFDENSRAFELQNEQLFLNTCPSVVSNNFRKGGDALKDKRKRSNSLPTICIESCHDFITMSKDVLEANAKIIVETERMSSAESSAAVLSSNANASNETTLSQSTSLSLTWQSVAVSSQMRDFKEEFGQSLGDLCNYVDYLHQEVFKSSLFRTVDDDSRDDSPVSVVEQSSANLVEEEVDGKMNGTVLSAERNLLYIKCDNGHLISCPSENFSGLFKNCRNIGRHFAIGEKIEIVQNKFSKGFSVCHSSKDAYVSKNQCMNEAALNLEMSCEVCCSDYCIRYGRGQISILSKDVVCVMMASLEMAAFMGEHGQELLMKEVIGFSAEKVPDFMTPWRMKSIEKIDQSEDGIERHFPMETLQLKMTNDFGCQVHLTSASSSSSSSSSAVDDVIAVDCPSHLQDECAKVKN